MKKSIRLFGLFLLLFLAVVLVMGVSAADNVVFLQGGAKGSGATADDPCGTYGDALDALDLTKDGTVVICGPTTQTKAFNYGKSYTGSVTFTSVYGGVDYRKTNGAVLNVGEARFVLCGATKFENIHINATGAWWYIIANHNPLTMGEGINITGDGLKGGKFAQSIAILGGYQSGVNNPPTSDNADVNITLLSGRMYYVIPFNRSFVGDFTGTANIYIGGTAHVNTLHGSSERDGSTVGDVKITLTDNAVVDTFYGGTADVTLHSLELTWIGGTFGDIFDWSSRYTPTKTLTVTGETKLIASEKAQRRANFETIAAMFDSVEEYKASEGSDTPSAPVVTDRTVVFLQDGAMGDGSSPTNAVGSLLDAYEALDLTKDGTIVLCGPTTQNAAFDYGKEYAGSVTFTSTYGGVDYAKTANAALNAGEVRFVLRGETKFENITIHATGKWWYIIAQHNPLTMGAGITIKGELLKGGKFAQSIAILGGYQAGVGNPPLTDDKDVNITLLSGRMYYVIPFNRGNAGTYTGTANVYIGGNAQVDTLHGSSERTGSAVGDTKITVADNAFVKVFYGGTANVTLNSFELTWLGGSFGEIFDWDCRYMNPPTTMTITNGTKLIAADAVKSLANYADIAAMFDKVEDYTGTSVQKPNVQSDYGCARGLYTLGLAQGYDSTGTNFGLADKMTRVQTVVQVIRFLGVENEVKAGTFTHPFSDVPAWANNYVGYAYANNITKGVSATKFGTDDVTTEAQFLTFMLRAIGYSDQGGDFVWSDPFALANKIGMSETAAASASFLRGDAFRYSWNTLYATAKNGAPVYENLANAGVFTLDSLIGASDVAIASVELAKPIMAAPIVAPTDAATEYYVLSKSEYMNKTTAGFLGQMIGFLSDYKYVWNKNGTPRVALPEEWWLGICRGNDVAGNPYHTKIIKLYWNDETKMWDNWIADAYSIDIMGQHILRDMRENYGTFTTKVITDGWVKYAPWDMGGGARYNGAYALASKRSYITPYLGMAEFGNEYSWCQEPWIGNDGLGMAAAGMPNVALDLTRAYGRVTGDSDNVRWLDFVATMSSMAYFESDIKTLIDSAAAIFPKDSYEREVVDMAYELYARYPNNWRYAVIAAEEECARRFYYLHTEKSTNEQGRCEVNFAFMILALLYGDGDYMETAKILSLCGYDTRGTIMLPVLGIIGGMDAIPEEAKAVTWQNGKGMIVNKAVPDTVFGVWMFAEGLPERYSIASVIDLYRENFEWLLLQNGGKIEGDTYYIPKTALRTFDAVSVKNGDFETGTLEGYAAIGDAANVSITNFAYWGESAVQVNASGTADNGVYATIAGLKKGSTYRLSAYMIAANNTTANLFARVPGSDTMQAVGVYYQPEYVKRDLVFVAENSTMEIGLLVPAQDSYGYAIVDEIEVVRIEEYAVSDVSGVKITTAPAVANRYDGKVEIAVNGKTEGEAWIKVYFANVTGGIVDATVTVNGDDFRTVPFYKTGAVVSDGAADCVYIPVVLQEDTNTVALDFGESSIYVSAVQIVTVRDRLIAE